MAGKHVALAGILIALICGPTPGVAQDQTEAEVDTRVFGDWERTCTPVGGCRFSQANADPETDDIRMRTEISVVADNQILMSVIVPDSVLLTEGPWLTVDGLYVGELNYIRCGGGCLATLLFTDAQFRLVANGRRGAITVTAGGQRIGIVISFDGLAEGLASLGDPSED